MAEFNININAEGGVKAPLLDTAIAGEDLFRGTLCYLHTDGKYYKSDASDMAKVSTELRIAQVDVLADAESTFIEQGTYETLGLTIGVRYYASITPGEFTTTKYDPPNIIRYIGTASSATELQFNPMDIAQDSVFNSSLSPTLAIPVDWEENNEGITIAQLQLKNTTELIETLFFPDVAAYIATNASTGISGQNTSNLEVGTSSVQSITVTLNLGQINNGDNSTAGDVVGNMTSLTVNDPDSAQAYLDASPASNSEAIVLPGFNVNHSTNTWTIIVTNAAGTTTYVNNKGDATPVTSIENAKADLTRDNVTFSLTGLYNRWHYLGNQNTSPTTSGGVRALGTNAFFIY